MYRLQARESMREIVPEACECIRIGCRNMRIVCRHTIEQMIISHTSPIANPRQ
jgi:hypothetical protein